MTVGGEFVHLRRAEYRLLAFFMSHAGRSFNRTQLLAHVWGDDSAVVERTVDVNVQRLRKILNEARASDLHSNGARIRLPVRATAIK